MNTEYLYPPTPLVFFAASKKHYISLLFFLSISTTPKNTVASEEQEVSGRGPKEGETCERCLSGAPGRSTCPSYLMKRPLPMNLVTGSRLAPWQRNASLTVSPPQPLPSSSVRLHPPSVRPHQKKSLLISAGIWYNNNQEIFL